MQNKREVNKGKTRGRSEPPRKSYKPTGNIFGVDKPYLTSTTDCETNTEIIKINSENKARDQANCQLVFPKNKFDIANSDISPASKDKELEHEVANIEHVNETGDQAKYIIVENNMNDGNPKSLTTSFFNKTIPIKSINEFTVDNFDGEWEEVVDRKI
ncbi:hypothetical protein MTR67_026949 [Solanum verrucosum]|uniref:Uncharacterized protein n=1 Tax=Solanum verrucosum TaxID=315347 RepID=A0AAF0TVA2_SOLVR|nr:hypothetical protein MTR67_026949 [Solanum verrucosum]